MRRTALKYHESEKKKDTECRIFVTASEKRCFYTRKDREGKRETEKRDTVVNT